jgi:uncharacterized protein
VRDGKQEVGAKFSDYFDFAEKLAKVPSHRILALFRAEKEEILDVTIAPEDPATASAGCSAYEMQIMHRFGISHRRRPGDKWLMDTARQGPGGRQGPQAYRADVPAGRRGW